MQVSDIEYAKTRLIDELDKLAIDDDLRVKINMMLYFNLESTEALDESIDSIALNRGRKQLILERRFSNGNESTGTR